MEPTREYKESYKSRILKVLNDEPWNGTVGQYKEIPSIAKAVGLADVDVRNAHVLLLECAEAEFVEYDPALNRARLTLLGWNEVEGWNRIP